MSIIPENKFTVLKELVAYFDAENIEYWITGGLAGNIYGSKHPLHDIDIDVAKKDIVKIQEKFQENLLFPLTHIEDDNEFDLWMFALRFHEIIVEISQAENFYLKVDGIKIPFKLDLNKYKLIEFQGLKLRVQPLEQIIEYKKLLKNREIDVRELESLNVSKT